MKKQIIQAQQILAGEIEMDTQTKFHANGNINIYPCGWVDEQVTKNGPVHYRAGIKVDEDGRTRVKRYNDGMNGPMHETLFETAHAEVKMTRPLFESKRGKQRRRLDREFVYVTFKFPKKYGLTLMKSLYQEEAEEVMSYLRTRKEETVWG